MGDRFGVIQAAPGHRRPVRAARSLQSGLRRRIGPLRSVIDRRPVRLEPKRDPPPLPVVHEISRHSPGIFGKILDMPETWNERFERLGGSAGTVPVVTKPSDTVTHATHAPVTHVTHVTHGKSNAERQAKWRKDHLEALLLEPGAGRAFVDSGSGVGARRP